MIKKGIIWFLVLAFLNFIIVPDYVFADGSFDIGPIGPSEGETAAMAVGVLVVLGLIIAGIVALAKHSKSSTEKPQEQNQDTEISPHTNLDNQLITPSGEISLSQEQNQYTEVLPTTNLDNQVITSLGQITLFQW